MSITAKELAQKLGLSAAAVSMALNNKPGVSTETRQRVRDAAMRYGYDFSRIAEKKLLYRSVAFIIYKKYGTVVTDTPFFSQVTEGLSARCRELNYKLHISYCYEDENAVLRQVEELRARDFSGVILLGTEMTPRDIQPFLELPVPVVLLDAYYDTVPCDAVLINNVQGGYVAAEYLIRKCRTQPGYLRSSYMISNFHQRANGFYQAIRDAGMSPSKCAVHRLTPSLEGAMADMLVLLEQGEEPAPCYFADNDLIAAGAIQAFKSKGYRIPEDISVIGFDDIPIAQMPDLSLTTIGVSKQYLGALAADCLTNRLRRPLSPPVKIEAATTLVHRRSVREK